MTRESAEGSQRDGVGTPGTHLPGGAIPKGCPHEELLGAPRFTLLPSPAPRPYRRSSPVASRPQGKHRNHSAGPSASLTAQPRGVYLLPSNPGWAGTRGGAEGEHVTAHPEHLVEVSRVRRKMNQVRQTAMVVNVWGISAKVLVQISKNALGEILRTCTLL